ncbi:MAG: dTDP-4-dehydrorhamnose reductase [Bdellovibrionaceae bacterium]|nr:dTDP-4-dehydrorhamnose reductase [Pseudobdellovibrionaceae bacterium]
MNGPCLITGAKGLLGSEFARALDSKSIHALDKSQLDVTNRDSIWRVFERIQPRWVIHTAAYTQVDAAETNREAAHRLNAEGVKTLVEACREYQSRLVHFSTDQVFDGRKDSPYVETDETHPSNYYAQTKLESEREALALADALVLRVQWLYGAARPRFTHLETRSEFSAVCDQVGAPTWTRDVVRLTLQLLERNKGGLYHVSYDDYASWLEIFELVKAKLGYSVNIQSVTTAELNLPAGRPLNARLSNEKLKKALGVSSVGSWETSLLEFLAGLK